MKFNVLLDIDIDFLRERSKPEAILISKNPKQSRGREFTEIYATCMYGQAAEVYLMNQGFANDIRPFRDVIHPNGTPVEVKVTKHIGNIPYVLKAVKDKKMWDKEHPDVVYIWIGDNKSYDYYLHSIYNWNGTEFIVQ